MSNAYNSARPQDEREKLRATPAYIEAINKVLADMLTEQWIDVEWDALACVCSHPEDCLSELYGSPDWICNVCGADVKKP